MQDDDVNLKGDSESMALQQKPKSGLRRTGTTRCGDGRNEEQVSNLMLVNLRHSH
jgi:hypothetical protein